MKQLRPYPQVVITKKGARFVEQGHVWVFEDEVLELRDGFAGRSAQSVSGSGSGSGAPSVHMPSNGDVVDVVDEKGTYIGTGLLSLASKIRVRLITRNANDRFDEAFWARKAAWAWAYRKACMGADTDCCRLIFSEADAFGGLIVDRYEDVLVAEVLTYGMDRLKTTIMSALLEVLRSDGQQVNAVYERGDSSVRLKEGLPLVKGWMNISGCDNATDAATVRIVHENGIAYRIDLANNQKTGLFLDQKYNRRALARLAKGRRVLDCFTNVGTFALNAAAAGAAFVRGVDISRDAVAQARENAMLNHLDANTDFSCANVFDYLPALAQRDAMHRGGGPFDCIVLDPPAFTKSRAKIASAARGYKEINTWAMRLLPRGGYLATCSCSHFVDEKMFRAVIAEAAHDAGVQLRQVEARGQAPDHPIVWGIPETAYLKFFIFQVV